MPIKYKDESEAIEKNKNIDKNKIQKTKAKKSKQPTEEIKDKVVRGFFPRDDEVEIPSGFTKIGYFDQGNAVIICKGKYGLINYKGEIVIPTEYDYLKYIKFGVIYACNNSKVGLIDEDGDIITPFIYDYIGELTLKTLLPVYRCGKMGFIDLAGKEVIPITFDFLPNHFYDFRHNIEITIPEYCDIIKGVFFVNNTFKLFYHTKYGQLIQICYNGKWGLYNSIGEVVIPFKYRYIGEHNAYYSTDERGNTVRYNYPILVQKNELWGFVNEDFNTIIKVEYNDAIELIPCKKYKLRKDNLWGYVSFDGKGGLKFTAFRYNEIIQLHDELSIVRKGNKYGVIDDNYQELLPVEYDEIDDYLYNNKLKLRVRDKWGWAYYDGTHHYTLSPFIYEEIEDYTDGLALVKKNGMYGFINENWDEVIPFVYEEAFPFLDGISSVKHNEKWGVIDTNGDTLIPFEYEKLVNFSWLGPSAIVASKEGKVGVVDRQNRVIVPFEYTTIFPASNHLIVEKDGKKGLMNSEGNIVIPICCEEILYPILNIRALEQLFKYKIDGEWGVYNHFDGILVPAIYVDIPDTSFSCGRLSVCRDGKWGYINPKGKEIIPCIYDKNPGAFFPNEPVRVSLDGKEFCIDTKGNMV